TEAKGHAQRRFAELHPEPEVRAYCHVDRAVEDWHAAAPTFDADVARIAELETRAACRPELLTELHELYARTLRGANRRAVLAADAPAPTPELSVVIPVWSTTPELAEMASRTVTRVQQVATLTTEVIVVDNGSPHRTPFPGAVLVVHNDNEGV